MQGIKGVVKVAMKFLCREKSATNSTNWHENFVKFVLFVAKKESSENRLDFNKALAGYP